VVLSGQLSNHGLPIPARNGTLRPANRHQGPRTARNRALSPTTTQQLIDAYLAGATIRSIARDLDIHRTTIDNCLKRAGVKRTRQPVLTQDQLDQAEAAYLNGDSWVTIAQRFGVDPGTVGLRLKQRGVTMRPRRGGIRRAGSGER